MGEEDASWAVILSLLNGALCFVLRCYLVSPPTHIHTRHTQHTNTHQHTSTNTTHINTPHTPHTSTHHTHQHTPTHTTHHTRTHTTTHAPPSLFSLLWVFVCSPPTKPGDGSQVENSWVFEDFWTPGDSAAQYLFDDGAGEEKEKENGGAALDTSDDDDGRNGEKEAFGQSDGGPATPQPTTVKHRKRKELPETDDQMTEEGSNKKQRVSHNAGVGAAVRPLQQHPVRLTVCKYVEPDKRRKGKRTAGARSGPSLGRGDGC